MESQISEVYPIELPIVAGLEPVSSETPVEPTEEIVSETPVEPTEEIVSETPVEPMEEEIGEIVEPTEEEIGEIVEPTEKEIASETLVEPTKEVSTEPVVESTGEIVEPTEEEIVEPTIEINPANETESEPVVELAAETAGASVLEFASEIVQPNEIELTDENKSASSEDEDGNMNEYSFDEFLRRLEVTRSEPLVCSTCQRDHYSRFSPIYSICRDCTIASARHSDVIFSRGRATFRFLPGENLLRPIGRTISVMRDGVDLYIGYGLLAGLGQNRDKTAHNTMISILKSFDAINGKVFEFSSDAGLESELGCDFDCTACGNVSQKFDAFRLAASNKYILRSKLIAMITNCDQEDPHLEMARERENQTRLAKIIFDDKRYELFPFNEAASRGSILACRYLENNDFAKVYPNIQGLINWAHTMHDGRLSKMVADVTEMMNQTARNKSQNDGVVAMSRIGYNVMITVHAPASPDLFKIFMWTAREFARLFIAAVKLAGVFNGPVATPCAVLVWLTLVVNFPSLFAWIFTFICGGMFLMYA